LYFLHFTTYALKISKSVFFPSLASHVFFRMDAARSHPGGATNRPLPVIRAIR
jgi:hypothetical protein